MQRQINIAAIAVATVDGMTVENYARALRLSEIAAEDRPDIILLPEAFAAGYCGGDLRRFAESVDSEPLRRFAGLSRDAGCMIVVGCLLHGQDVRVRNSMVLFDRGQVIGVHTKKSLWPDKERPYRDEVSMMVPGEDTGVFSTRLGRIAVMTCYENMIKENWRRLPADVELVLSPYNCEDDPAAHNIDGSRVTSLPSAWANRTGTVYASDGWRMNPGTAGMVNAGGAVVVHTARGAEEIARGAVDVGG
jgi:predicted amidohydrolase